MDILKIMIEVNLSHKNDNSNDHGDKYLKIKVFIDDNLPLGKTWCNYAWCNNLCQICV